MRFSFLKYWLCLRCMSLPCWLLAWDITGALVPYLSLNRWFGLKTNLPATYGEGVSRSYVKDKQNTAVNSENNPWVINLPVVFTYCICAPCEKRPHSKRNFWKCGLANTRFFLSLWLLISPLFISQKHKQRFHDEHILPVVYSAPCWSNLSVVSRGRWLIHAVVLRCISCILILPPTDKLCAAAHYLTQPLKEGDRSSMLQVWENILISWCKTSLLQVKYFLFVQILNSSTSFTSEIVAIQLYASHIINIISQTLI